MLFPDPGTALHVWISHFLSAFSHAGTAIIVGLFVASTILATRCQGCCREDDVFRPHVI